MKLTYNHTLRACFLANVVCAISNNFVPLLYVTFQKQFGLTLWQLGLLALFNFGMQILVDSLGARFADRIPYRAGAMAAMSFTALGLLLLGILPYVMHAKYAAVVISVCCYAIGNGLSEVLISPITEAIPAEGKASRMSLMHSFYCWGHVGVVLLATGYFTLFGVENWRWLCFVFMLLPLATAVLFSRVPIGQLQTAPEHKGVRKLFGSGLFWMFFVLMICSGAAEQSMAQWASLFAEEGLAVSKTLGDLLGPCAFAVLMGLARLYYGKKGEKLQLQRSLLLSGCLCVAAYLLTVFAPWPLLSLVGCALCGLSVGVMWPGVLSLSSRYVSGGTAMFALLALGGDIGCFSGPGIIGAVASGSSVKTGLLIAAVFPVILLVAVVLLRRKKPS